MYFICEESVFIIEELIIEITIWNETAVNAAQLRFIGLNIFIPSYFIVEFRTDFIIWICRKKNFLFFIYFLIILWSGFRRIVAHISLPDFVFFWLWSWLIWLTFINYDVIIFVIHILIIIIIFLRFLWFWIFRLWSWLVNKIIYIYIIIIVVIVIVIIKLLLLLLLLLLLDLSIYASRIN